MSQGGVLWRIEIWSEADAAFPSVGSLRFPYDTPLTIEWDTKELHEPLCGAVATLTVVSETDRQFTSFYRTAVCGTQLRVYRQGVLFWSGTLNTEEYTEPFQTFDGYEVTLTFSDLGAAEYVRFSPGTALSLSVGDLLRTAGEALGLELDGKVSWEGSTNYNVADANLTIPLAGETGARSGYTGVPSTLHFAACNYYDYDGGEWLTWKETLEDVLTALGMRLVQWWGRLRAFTIDGLFRNKDGTPYWPAATVRWTADEQTLEMGNVFNNVAFTVKANTGEYQPISGDDDGQQTGAVVKSWKLLNPSATVYDPSNVKIYAQSHCANTVERLASIDGEVIIDDERTLPVRIVEGTDGLGGRLALLWHSMQEATGSTTVGVAWQRAQEFRGKSVPATVCDRFADWIANGNAAKCVPVFTKGRKVFHTKRIYLDGLNSYALGVNVPLLCSFKKSPAFSTTLGGKCKEGPVSVKGHPEADNETASDSNGQLRDRELCRVAPMCRIPYTIYIRNGEGKVVCYLEAMQSTSQGYSQAVDYTAPVWHTLTTPADVPPVPEYLPMLHYCGMTKFKKRRGDADTGFYSDFQDCISRYDAATIYNAQAFYADGEDKTYSAEISGGLETISAPPVSGMAELVVFEGVFFTYCDPYGRRVEFSKKVGDKWYTTGLTADPFKHICYPCETAEDLLSYDPAQSDHYNYEPGGQTALCNQYKELAWIAYGLPEMKVINPTTGDAPSYDDREYNTQVETGYKNSLELSTRLGTGALAAEAYLSCFYYVAQGKVAINEMICAWRNRLITTGTAADWDDLAYVVSAQWFSQYDTAKIILSGECALCGTGADNAPLLYREEHYPDKMFLLKGGTLTAQTDAFEATFQEIVPTRYARKRS